MPFSFGSDGSSGSGGFGGSYSAGDESQRVAQRVSAISSQFPELDPDSIMQFAQSQTPIVDQVQQIGGAVDMGKIQDRVAVLNTMTPELATATFNRMSDDEKKLVTDTGYVPPAVQAQQKTTDQTWYHTILDNAGKPFGAVKDAIGASAGTIMGWLGNANDFLSGRPIRAAHDMDAAEQLGRTDLMLNQAISEAGLNDLSEEQRRELKKQYMLRNPHTYFAVGNDEVNPLSGSFYNRGTDLGQVNPYDKGATTAVDDETYKAFEAKAYQLQTTPDYDTSWGGAWGRTATGDQYIPPSVLVEAQAKLGKKDSEGYELAVYAAKSDKKPAEAIQQWVADKTGMSIDDPRFGQEYTRLAQTYLADQNWTDTYSMMTKNESRVSLGRDFADTLKLHPDSKVYTAMSGTADALAVLALDPTLIAGKFFKTAKAASYLVDLADGASAVNRVADVQALGKIATAAKEGKAAVSGLELADVFHAIPEADQAHLIDVAQLKTHADVLKPFFDEQGLDRVGALLTAEGKPTNYLINNYDGITKALGNAADHLAEHSGVGEAGAHPGALGAFDDIDALHDIVKNSTPITSQAILDTAKQAGIPIADALRDPNAAQGLGQVIQSTLGDSALYQWWQMRAAAKQTAAAERIADAFSAWNSTEDGVHLDHLLQDMPHMSAALEELKTWNQALKTTGEGIRSADDVFDWYRSAAGRTTLSRGAMWNSALSPTLSELPRITAGRTALRGFTNAVTSGIDFMRTSGINAEARGISWGEWANMSAKDKGVVYNLTRPIRGTGKLLFGLTHQIPETGVLPLVGENTNDVARKFIDAGAFADMDRTVMKRYMADYLGAESMPARWQVYRGFMRDFMERIGAFDNPEFADRANEFVTMMDNQKYAIGNLDQFPAGSVTARGAILPESQWAGAVELPRFRELAANNQRLGMIGKVMGKVNRPTVDAFMSVGWKPAMLLRAGFIPRTFGDEMLNFMGRFGLEGVEAKFAAMATNDTSATDWLTRKVVPYKLARNAPKEALEWKTALASDTWKGFLEHNVEQWGFKPRVGDRLAHFVDFHAAKATSLIKRFEFGLAGEERQVGALVGSGGWNDAYNSRLLSNYKQAFEDNRNTIERMMRHSHVADAYAREVVAAHGHSLMDGSSAMEDQDARAMAKVLYTDTDGLIWDGHLIGSDPNSETMSRIAVNHMMHAQDSFARQGVWGLAGKVPEHRAQEIARAFGRDSVFKSVDLTPEEVAAIVDNPAGHYTPEHFIEMRKHLRDVEIPRMKDELMAEVERIAPGQSFTLPAKKSEWSDFDRQLWEAMGAPVNPYSAKLNGRNIFTKPETLVDGREIQAGTRVEDFQFDGKYGQEALDHLTGLVSDVRDLERAAKGGTLKRGFDLPENVRQSINDRLGLQSAEHDESFLTEHGFVEDVMGKHFPNPEDNIAAGMDPEQAMKQAISAKVSWRGPSRKASAAGGVKVLRELQDEFRLFPPQTQKLIRDSMAGLGQRVPAEYPVSEELSAALQDGGWKKLTPGLKDLIRGSKPGSAMDTLIKQAILEDDRKLLGFLDDLHVKIGPRYGHVVTSSVDAHIAEAHEVGANVVHRTYRALQNPEVLGESRWRYSRDLNATNFHPDTGMQVANPLPDHTRSFYGVMADQPAVDALRTALHPEDGGPGLDKLMKQLEDWKVPPADRDVMKKMLFEWDSQFQDGESYTRNLTHNGSMQPVTRFALSDHEQAQRVTDYMQRLLGDDGFTFGLGTHRVFDLNKLDKLTAARIAEPVDDVSKSLFRLAPEHAHQMTPMQGLRQIIDENGHLIEGGTVEEAMMAHAGRMGSQIEQLYTHNGDIMHELVEPTLRGEFTASTLYNTPISDLPAEFIAPNVVAKDENWWSKVVQKGFSEHLMPMGDSFIRRPMYALHMGKALKATEGLEAVLRDPEVFAKGLAAAGEAGVSDIEGLRRVWDLLPEWTRGQVDNAAKFKDVLGAVADQGTRDADGVLSGAEAAAEKIAELAPEKAQDVLNLLIHDNHVDRTIVSAAGKRAMNDMAPYIHDHKVRSFYQEYARNIMPFEFAQEQFLKRWARTFVHSPEAIQRDALIAHGFSASSFVHKDENGNDVFVMPFSDAATRIIAKAPVISALWGGPAEIPVNVPLTGQVSTMLAGGLTDLTETPSLSPIAQIPANMLANHFPEVREYAKPILGEHGATDENVLMQLMPSWAKPIAKGIFSGSDASTELNNATIGAMQMMQAEADRLNLEADELLKKGDTAGSQERRTRAAELVPAEDWSADRQQEYIDNVKQWARGLMVARGIVGFGAPSQPHADIGKEAFDPEFKALMRNMSYDEAYAVFMAEHPEAHAYTVFGTERVSGAPLPDTEASLQWMTDNKDFLDRYQLAAPWLMPQAKKSDEFNQQAYHDQVADGMRVSKAPVDWWRDMKFNAAASPYFETKKLVDAKLLDAGQNPVYRKQLTDWWSNWSRIYKDQHPVFKADLESGDSRGRRAQALEELRTALVDPALPDAGHVEDVKALLKTYDQFREQTALVAGDSRKGAKARRDQLADWLIQYGNAAIEQNPELTSVWRNLIEPAAGVSDRRQAQEMTR